jgi:hypothetical protein
MRAVDPAVSAAFASSQVGLVTLLKIEFPGGTVALNNSNFNFNWGGTDYLGASSMGSISAITDQPGELQGVQLELVGLDASLIALALDASDQVQGSLVTISTAVVDMTTYQIIDVEIDWTGYADKMSIGEDGEKASVVLTAENKGVDLLRGNPLTFSDPDHQTLYPGDRAFEYVVNQADQPVVWPAKSWFYL